MGEKPLPVGVFMLADLPGQMNLDAEVLSTGWGNLDPYFKLYPGQFVIITGLAGSGKSTFALNLVARMTQREAIRPFLYMPENETALKDKMRGLWTGTPESFEYFASHECVIKSSIYDTNDESRTMHWVLDSAYKSIEGSGAELVLIDPWNELERAMMPGELLTDYIRECIFEIKDFCRKKKMIVMLIAHPTKAHIAENRTPTLADIEGSMNWFNKCDNGLIVVRDKEISNVTKIISAKVRYQPQAGKPGETKFWVNAETGIFTPMQIGENHGKS